MALRPKAPYPVLLQVVFGLSFIAFLYFFESLKEWIALLWIWSFFQLLVGLLLVRGRILANRLVYYCVRCTPALP
jgi:hypothetical protein